MGQPLPVRREKPICQIVMGNQHITLYLGASPLAVSISGVRAGLGAAVETVSRRQKVHVGTGRKGFLPARQIDGGFTSTA